MLDKKIKTFVYGFGGVTFGWFFASGMDELLSQSFSWFTPVTKIAIAVAGAFFGYWKLK